VRDGRVVKGVRFQGLRDAGDPGELAARYEEQGADEVALLDVSATLESRGAALDAVRRARGALSIPLSVGRGVRSAADAERLLDAGADKVALNSAAVLRPALIAECAERFGSQCVVVSIDAARGESGADRWAVRTRGGTEVTGLDAVAWARTVTELGAGEILLTSWDRDGTRGGYDLALTRAVASAVPVPVIASGGAGGCRDFVDAFDAGASAVLAASVFHDGEFTVGDVKRFLSLNGVPVRP